MITPVFNGALTISKTIESIAIQAPWCCEYIVIDGMSTDATPSIIEARRDVVTHYIREKDEGIYDAMNKGVSAASGDVIGIINADDYLNEYALRDVVAAFADETLDFVYADADLRKPDGTAYGVMRARQDWVAGSTEFLGRDWRFAVPFAHQTLFVKRTVYARLGLFDRTFRLAADHEFMARLIANRMRGRYIPRSLATYVLGGAASQSGKLFAEDEKIAVRYGMHPALAKWNRIRSTLGRMKASAMGRY
jgi:glycosyltransferase involved in cell wall biosynthesis